ncbi:methylated-DNA--[protein]-cysteine S-methyltransferase [Marinicella gelatinilytica]|uniref:methylated-DNA--[protein]-cysteine S-methyltransferase n=1 Tax=Marinicella gelatinilytica TaxID=2996017 RepID=UPI002260F3DF|nr:methylated-DNA--[protein]-cysteine S-methyltransferase [Marinicella gelatinilytica]MCX7545361.1 methylated-DNA--[protein]-cysteine S-methyltransferase [Marinicella gelatinilytica]
MTVKQKPLAKQVVKAPFGNLYLYADDSHLTGIAFREINSLNAKRDGNHPILQKTVQQLSEYFSGQRQRFDLPIKFKGTDFQQQVWQQLKKIDYGHTETYGQVADAIKNPKAVRAVGNANNKNPIVIVVPCHRVIGANGNMVGYGGGLPVKEWLLKHEQRHS